MRAIAAVEGRLDERELYASLILLPEVPAMISTKWLNSTNVDELKK